MTRQRVCKVEDLKVNEVRKFEVGTTPIALVRLADGFHALHDVCSHFEYPLSDGEVWAADCALECRMHGATFDLKTGAPNGLPATEPVKVYEVHVENGEVAVEIS